MARALLITACLLMLSCTQVEVSDYHAEQPALDLRQYFVGEVDAWGMFQERSGKVIKRFHVLIKGSLEGQQLILDEQFTYSDGSHQQRIWRLTETTPGHWRGTAADVRDEAIGEVSGNALRWRYVLKLPVDDKVYDVHFDDWMYLLDEKTLANRSFMSKFGVELGQVTLFFRKRS